MKSEIFEFSVWLESSDPQLLQKKFDAMLRNSGFTILDFIDHAFVPHGYTAIWLLSDSHFAIHTFPETKQAYVQLSSCNKKKYDIFINRLKNLKIYTCSRTGSPNLPNISSPFLNFSVC
ncbi:MAG: S-adenosylmethionine decarboxylase [Desulfosarcina sp.]|nr:S-adenosylmethionine decarboxylase [Desulfobacterales bacterium]